MYATNLLLYRQSLLARDAYARIYGTFQVPVPLWLMVSPGNRRCGVRSAMVRRRALDFRSFIVVSSQDESMGE